MLINSYCEIMEASQNLKMYLFYYKLIYTLFTSCEEILHKAHKSLKIHSKYPNNILGGKCIKTLMCR